MSLSTACIYVLVFTQVREEPRFSLDTFNLIFNLAKYKNKHFKHKN